MDIVDYMIVVEEGVDVAEVCKKVRERVKKGLSDKWQPWGTMRLEAVEHGYDDGSTVIKYVVAQAMIKGVVL